MIEARSHWVVVFDCGEAAIVAGVTHGEAMAVRDPLDCLPVAAHPLAACRLRREPWVKEGMLRCDLAEVTS